MAEWVNEGKFSSQASGAGTCSPTKIVRNRKKQREQRISLCCLCFLLFIFRNTSLESARHRPDLRRLVTLARVDSPPDLADIRQQAHDFPMNPLSLCDNQHARLQRLYMPLTGPISLPRILFQRACDDHD